VASDEQLHVHDRAAYRITVQGFLDERWSDWLEGMRVVQLDGVGAAAQTVLEGNLTDQSALVGVLGVLQGLGLPVISVEYLGQDKRNL
jgi:hypothetical protein